MCIISVILKDLFFHDDNICWDGSYSSSSGWFSPSPYWLSWAGDILDPLLPRSPLSLFQLLLPSSIFGFTLQRRIATSDLLKPLFTPKGLKILFQFEKTTSFFQSGVYIYCQACKNISRTEKRHNTRAKQYGSFFLYTVVLFLFPRLAALPSFRLLSSSLRDPRPTSPSPPTPSTPSTWPTSPGSCSPRAPGTSWLSGRGPLPPRYGLTRSERDLLMATLSHRSTV